ncbi:hypothetical protein DRQ09_09155 [candidate division KSB1 bacterium]|mgnify:CR=1 FL=1|nr:MAG: hypothetical protein DRQ09_09155 [candidate division KSB1 bacterium]
MIDSYKFGEIVVDGVKYTSDIIITEEGIKENWWRKEGHKLCLQDLHGVLWEGVETLVVGSGCYGLMSVLPDVKNFLAEKNISLEVSKTGNAVKIFNKLSKDKKIIGAFHLTC